MPDDPNYLLAQTGESQWGWPWIWSGSEWHGTGNRPSSGVQLCFAKPIEKVDPRDYRPFSYPEPGPQMPVKVKNQDGKGACNGHAAATTLEMARWVAGMTPVDLSAWFIYAILCNGVDQGSSIDDALDLLTKTGTCPETDVPYGTINPRSLTDQARRDAARYKIEIGTKLVTWDDLMSATMLGRPFNFSICVGANFNNLDSNGVVGYTSGYGNHAVSGGWGAKEIGGGEWAIRWQNSWGATWGLRGFAYFTRQHWEKQQYAAAYDLVAVTDDPQDPEPFPVPRMAYELPGVETPCSNKSTFYIPRTLNV